MKTRPEGWRSGTLGILLAIIGGVLLILGPLLLLYLPAPASVNGGPGTITVGEFDGLQEAPDDYNYGWLMAVAGIIGIILSLVAIRTQRKAAAFPVIIFGLVGLLTSLMLANDLANYFGWTILEVFYYSEGGISQIYFGGILAIIGGILAMVGGGMLIGVIRANQQLMTLEEQVRWKEESERQKERVEREAKLDEKRRLALITEEEREISEAERRTEREAKEALEKSMETTISLNVPINIGVRDTGVITVEINNDSDDVINKITFDLSDLDTYFEVSGRLEFTNVKVGAEVRSNVKVQPKRDEGTYPIVIEIIKDGVSIEKKYFITVEGRDAY